MMASEHIGESSCECAKTTAAERNRIVQQARQLLRDRLHGFNWRIDFAFARGTLTITGQLPSFYLKQIVQATILELDGVQGIDNRVDVIYPSRRDSVGYR